MRPKRAKLFRSGASQAVCLPKEFRFLDGQTEVLVHRDGRKIVLEPVATWPDAFVACLGSWDEEIERPARASMRKVGKRSK